MRAGQVFFVTNPSGIVRADGQPFRVGDPISAIASQNEAGGALPLNSHVASPRIRQPYSDQFSVGWSHQLTEATVFDLDYIHSEGRDLGWRIQLNQRNPGAATRQFADLPLSPANVTIDISDGKSRYDGVNVGLRRRMTGNLSFSAWYSLAKATSTTGNASDELNIQNIQNHLDPYADVQVGPSGRSDARHRTTLSMVWLAPGGITVSPIFRYRSALPINTTRGIDTNNNLVANEITDRAWKFTGFDDNGVATFEDIGPCETINCSRGAAQSQMNLRLSKSFSLGGQVRLEAIGEVFNLFNARNPATFTGRQFSATGAPLSSFMQPTEFAGDFQNPEQRVGQIGFRLTF
jgi:hypothetical protein